MEEDVSGGQSSGKEEPPDPDQPPVESGEQHGSGGPIDIAKDKLEEVKEKLGPKLEEAKEKLGPKIEEAGKQLGPTVEKARSRLGQLFNRLRKRPTQEK